jgi:biotin transport system substrate-specific component
MDNHGRGAGSDLRAIHRLAWIAVMAALTAAGAVVAVPVNPLSPVPITLQTMFVLLAGLILGPKGGAAAMLLYLLAGAAGLPVFAGFKSGLAVLLGPTGGFILGFIPAAALAGLAGRRPPRHLAAALGLLALATAATLALGVVQLSLALGMSLGKAFAAGALPFIPGGILKIGCACGIHRFMARRALIPA